MQEHTLQDFCHIIKATREDSQTLHNLMQYYFYDFSEFNQADVEIDGKFGSYPFLDVYWEEIEDRFPFIVYYNQKPAGFVLVRRIQYEQQPGFYFSIAEFFIMRKYRRYGLGKFVAQQMFKDFKGNWEVFQIATNKPAQSFWIKVIDDYTQGNFTTRETEQKVYQLFKS